MMILIFLLYARAMGLTWKGERRWATLVAAGNAVTVLFMCGLSECPDNPTRYLWF